MLKNIDDGGPAHQAVSKAATMTAQVRAALEGLDDEAPVDEVARRPGGKVSPAVLAMAKALLVQAGGARRRHQGGRGARRVRPEAYDPKLDVDFPPLRDQDPAAAGFGRAA